MRRVATPLELHDHPADLLAAGFVRAPTMGFPSVEADGAAARPVDGTRLPLPASPEAGAGVRLGDLAPRPECVERRVALVE